MARSTIRLGLLLAGAVWLGAEPAAAQFNPFGWLFGEPPPRREQPGSRPLPPPPRQLPPGPPPGVRSQPLPPPPGTGRPPRGRSADPQTGEETPPPVQKIPNPTAVFSGLDKITGRIINFDVAVNETVQFGALQVTPRVCYTRPSTETQNTDAFIEVDEVTLQGEVRRIFTGWMFASSPGLHAVEHSIYDVWLNTCKREAPNTTVTTQAPARR